jgi:hypothetical protein
VHNLEIQNTEYAIGSIWEFLDTDTSEFLKTLYDEVLNKLGSDIDENGVPYWLKAKQEQIKGRDDV